MSMSSPPARLGSCQSTWRVCLPRKTSLRHPCARADILIPVGDVTASRSGADTPRYSGSCSTSLHSGSFGSRGPAVRLDVTQYVNYLAPSRSAHAFLSSVSLPCLPSLSQLRCTCTSTFLPSSLPVYPVSSSSSPWPSLACRSAPSARPAYLTTHCHLLRFRLATSVSFSLEFRVILIHQMSVIFGNVFRLLAVFIPHLN
ncbi:hypothetical protein C8R45DRAFT_570065 [Mycena sanguinolenta]|nr:hypothetical protein C8R45DRAFT_570065 [Mycena sanguinolenta]